MVKKDKSADSCRKLVETVEMTWRGCTSQFQTWLVKLSRWQLTDDQWWWSRCWLKAILILEAEVISKGNVWERCSIVKVF